MARRWCGLEEFSLVTEHRCGYGSLAAALARGQLDIQRLRVALTAVPLPRTVDRQLVLPVDITCWLWPEAHPSPDRISCHAHGRGKDQHPMIPEWSYPVICALETGRPCWTAPLNARRLAPGEDTATVAASQLRQTITLLIAAGHWRTGDLTPGSWPMPVTTGPRLVYHPKDCPLWCWLGCARDASCDARPGHECRASRAGHSFGRIFSACGGGAEFQAVHGTALVADGDLIVGGEPCMPGPFVALPACSSLRRGPPACRRS